MTPPIFIDKKIIGSKVYIKSNLIKMKRSPFQIKIPKLNSDIAYLGGAIFGDGNLTLIKRKVSKYPRTKLRIINSSKNFLKYLNKIFLDNFNANGKIYKKKNSNCYILEINSKIIWLYFTKVIGMKAKKKINLHIPSIFRTKTMLKYFIAGLFDTDGYYSNGRFGIMMTRKNYNFLKEIKLLTKKFYKFNFLGPYKDKINLNGKIHERARINLSTFCNSEFRKIIPLKIKNGSGRI